MTETPDTVKKSFRLTPFIFLGILLIWLGIRLIAPDSVSLFAGTRPDYLGVREGKLPLVRSLLIVLVVRVRIRLMRSNPLVIRVAAKKRSSN